MLCPCGSGLDYSGCCEPLHLGAAAETAEALMRSRFSAFALRSTKAGLDAYLLSSWHPSTRPAKLEIDDGTVWRKLQVVDTMAGGPGDDTGVVEFRASYRDGGGLAGVMHERSRFERERGLWRYLDGEAMMS
ncbi:MAG TPA: YchJ family metal-binding protein [Pseudolysinimonas sp.]|nr:YchJ family metal-binding protein [Pseudolysinimonas sp.]